MSPKKFSYVMVSLVVLLFAGVIGVTAGGYLLLKSQSEKLSNLKAQDEVTKQQEVSLAQAKADIAKYTPLDDIAKSVVPQDKDQAKTVREINIIAAQSGISLQQISFDTSTLGLPSGSSSGSSPNSSQNLSQVKPVEGIPGVYSLGITVSTGDSSPVAYNQFLQFLEKLEANRRTAHVSSISVTPSDKNTGEVNFSLVLDAYLKP